VGDAWRESDLDAFFNDGLDFVMFDLLVKG